MNDESLSSVFLTKKYLAVIMKNMNDIVYMDIGGFYRVVSINRATAEVMLERGED